MADDKRLFVKPRYPVHVFGARQGEWPEIGPNWTEVTPEQADAAEAEGAKAAVVLDRMEIHRSQRLMELTPGETDSTGNEPVTVEMAPPSQNASTEEWRAYAQQRGLAVFEGAKRSDIQAIVAAADEPKTNEEV